MVGSSLWVLRLLPQLKLVAMNDIAEILLKMVLKHQKSNQIYLFIYYMYTVETCF